MPLDEWQEYALEAAMGERADGRWVSKFVGISAPRQNGKSQLIVARALAGVLLFGEKTIIISAHETDTAREVWKRLINVIEDNPTLEARVTGRMDAINREFVSFGHGIDKQTIKLKARGNTGSRGFSADCLLLDEAQILGKRAWGAIVPTMSAMPNPQMWLFGTPPTDGDDPYAFTRVRESSKAKKPRHAWLEWAAAPGDDLDDPAVWAKANPAYGVRITHEACVDDRAAMDDEQFSMERLGMWATAKRRDAALDVEAWSELADESAVPEGTPDYYSLSISPERIGYIGVGFQVEDRQFIDLAEAGRVDDSRLLVQWFAERRKGNPRMTVAIDTRDPAAALVNDLRAARIKVNVTTRTDSARASVGLAEAITDGSVFHVDQPAVRDALLVARKKPIDKAGLWEFDPDDDIAALRAITLARYGLTFKKRKRAGEGRTSNRRAGVVL